MTTAQRKARARVVLLELLDLVFGEDGAEEAAPRARRRLPVAPPEDVTDLDRARADRALKRAGLSVVRNGSKRR